MMECIVTNEEKVEKKRSPGNLLRRARENAKLTQQDIARHLYLTVQVIDAIETDAYAKMPSLAFAKGYLRSYANLVNLPVDSVLQAFHALGIVEIKKGSQVQQVPLYRSQSSAYLRQVRWVTYGIASGLLLLVLLWWKNHNASLPSPAALDTEVKLQTADWHTASAGVGQFTHEPTVIAPLLMPILFEVLYPQIGLQLATVPIVATKDARYSTKSRYAKKAIRRKKIEVELNLPFQ